MLNPDFKDMLFAFLDAKAEFLVVGAYALAAHGVPRATGDLDFWIRRTEPNAERIERALRAFGAPTHDLQRGDFLRPDLVFQIGVEPSRIDILTSIDGVEFEEAWAERTITRIDGLDVPLLSLRHVIQNKRAVGRPRDLADIAALEAEQGRRTAIPPTDSRQR